MGQVIPMNARAAESLALISMRSSMSELERVWEISNIVSSDPDAANEEIDIEDAMRYIDEQKNYYKTVDCMEDDFFGEEDDMSFLDVYAERMFGV